MPLLKEVPREVKEGKKRERRWARRLWMKKNWKWFVPTCVGAIVAVALLVLLIVGIVWYSQRRACYLAHSRPEEVTEIRIGSGECNNEKYTVLDLSVFKNLKSIVIGDGSYMYVNGVNTNGLNKLESIVIGDECFINVNEVKMIGLSELESVEIGENSFTKKKNSAGDDPNRHFYMKNCPKLKSLKMGRYSFSDYTVCEIENVDALQVIEMGDLYKVSHSFYHASLELKSILIHSE